MDDLISRKAILKHIEEIRQGVQMMDDIRRASIIMNGMHLCEEAVRNQPSAQPEVLACGEGELSAQPERKKGHWIIKDNPGTGWYRVTCSECGEDVTSNVPMIGFLPNAKALWNFCPDCGADMRGEHDGD